MFILASGSPRRRELLAQIGCRFRVMASNAEELMENLSDPRELVIENARSKAIDVASKNAGEYSLGADTVVYFDGRVLGKPTGVDDAISMLSELSDRTHYVATGIAFAKDDKVFSDVSVTEVTFGLISKEDIISYVSTGEPLDKAGSYGIQGRAAAFVKEIKGSYSNVVGLPLYDLVKLANIAGVDLYGNGEGTTG